MGSHDSSVTCRSHLLLSVMAANVSCFALITYHHLISCFSFHCKVYLSSLSNFFCLYILLPIYLSVFIHYNNIIFIWPFFCTSIFCIWVSRINYLHILSFLKRYSESLNHIVTLPVHCPLWSPLITSNIPNNPARALLRTNTADPVVFTLTPPECFMEIRSGYGLGGNRIAGPVHVGDPITLLVYMRSGCVCIHSRCLFEKLQIPVGRIRHPRQWLLRP